MGLAGLCASLDISPLLAAMVMGMAYINESEDLTIFAQIEKFTPPIFLLFFVLSGMKLNIHSFKVLGHIGVAYFIIRIIGKYLGAYLAAHYLGSPREIRDYLGFALIPQAGVSIGLAFLGKRLLSPEMGDMLLTIILTSSVLYELIGPVSAKFALIKSGAIKPREKNKIHRRSQPEEASL